MKIVFVGGGNMASALIGGMLSNGFDPKHLGVVEINSENRSRLEASYRDISVMASLNPAEISNCNVVVLAVKPQQLKSVACQLNGMLSANTIVLSIAAGIRLSDLEKWLGQGNPELVVVRAMPNTPALVGAGITGLCSSPHKDKLTSQQQYQVEVILKAVGEFVWVASEQQMDAVTAVSGSGPAYFFYFIEALAQAGVDLGLPDNISRKLAVATASGSAKLAYESSEALTLLRERVTSKNGTTERALMSMEDNLVKEHIIMAIKAAAARSIEMGQELGDS